MRRLARSLVRDPELAEELAQETWIRLLQQPPRTGGPVRGWIATVMRNLRRTEVRGRTRREARELETWVERPAPQPPDLLERAQLQRALVDAVLALEEPYRRTVLLRYFEERTPSAIARQEGLPVATVKTRLSRGLAQLRERLGRTEEPGGRGSVLAGLLAVELASRPAPFVPLLIGAATVKTKLVVLAFLVAAAAVLWPRDPEPARGPRDQTASTSADAGRNPSPPAPALPAEPRRAVTPDTGPGRSLPAASTSTVALVRGRVVDQGGRGLPGIAVARGTGSLRVVVARTDEQGRFAADPGKGSGRIEVEDPHWTTVLAASPVVARASDGPPPEPVVVAAPVVDLAGQVVDGQGVPVPGARVRLVLPEDLRARIPLVLDYSSEVQHATDADPGGDFELAGLPALAGARLHAEATGHDPAIVECPTTSSRDLLLVLGDAGSRRDDLAGRVVDALDQPVAGAHVSWGLESRVTDERGRFAFPREDPDSMNERMARHVTPDTTLLRAVRRGHLPGEVRARTEPDGTPVWPDPIALRLGPPPLALEGLVVDAGGLPLAGMEVWVADPTLFGAVADPGRPDDLPRLTHVESLLGGAPPGWNRVETDEQGRFRIEGLLDRDYTLEAMDPGTLLRAELPHARPGPRHVTLRLDGALFATLRGRVVDRRGTPLEGISVYPMCDAFRTRVSGQVASTHHSAVEAVVTDERGAFVLERVPRDLVYLRVNGADTIPIEWGRGIEGGLASLIDDPEELVLEVGRRCHFQVELAVTDEADEVGMLDARGEPLGLSEFQGNGRMDGPRLPLSNGRSSNLAVSDAATFLVLYLGGEEVRRVPVRLEPGQPTVLRP
jgi:RNA polymerase sigma-70 factor (ECF subfamily)